MPTAARVVVARTLGFGDPKYWAQRSADGFLLNAPGLRASLSRAGAVVSAGGVSWRLGLQGHGPASLSADHNRVVYRRRGVSEWYVDGPLGVEQGFTVAKPSRKASGGTLVLSIGRRPDGFVARPDRDGHGLTLSLRDRVVLRYSNLSATDASGRALPARIQLSRGRVSLLVNASSAQYPVRVDPLVHAADVPVSAKTFGASVAISTDGQTIAVGAPGSKVDGNVSQGAVYVFKRGARGWANEHEVARLTASDGAPDDDLGTGQPYFGKGGVAISRHGTTIVAGAPLATVDGHPQTGAAYVFTMPAGGWMSEQETAKLTASNPGDFDHFGTVAVSGDGRTIAVSATQVNAGDNYYPGTGALYVFTKPVGGWKSGHEQAELAPTDTSASGEPALAISDDGATIVLGASNAVYNGQYEEHYYSGDGAAYVFVRPADGWRSGHQTARLTPLHGRLGAAFGSSIALSSDGATVAVGKPGSTVYVFTRRASGWSNEHPTARLTLSRHIHPTIDAALAISAGGATIAVGGPVLNGKRGAVYVFRRRGHVWSSEHQLARLTALHGHPGDNLGVSVAMSGAGTIVSGAEGADRGQGAAYVYERGGHGWSSGHQSARLTASISVATDNFGDAVATSGDGATIVVGAPGARVGTDRFPGVAYVFTKTAGGWNTIRSAAVLSGSHGATGDGLGESVAISGNGETIVLAAPGATIDKRRTQGAIYVFKEPAGGWVSEHQVGKLTASDGQPGDGLGAGGGYEGFAGGSGVAISRDGGTIVAGAPAQRHGKLYVFSRPPSGWSSEHEAAELTSSSRSDFLGFPVGISASGDTIIAGSSQSVMVYPKPQLGWSNERQSAVLAMAPSTFLDSLAISADGSTVAAGDESVGSQTGTVLVFKEPSGGWSTEPSGATLTAPDSPKGLLDTSLAMSADGRTIAASASGSWTDPTTYPSTVAVFTEPIGGWTSESETARLTASDGSLSDFFGSAVAIAGNGQTVVATAPWAGASSQGAVYTFVKPSSGWSDEHETARLSG